VLLRRAGPNGHGTRTRANNLPEEKEKEKTRIHGVEIIAADLLPVIEATTPSGSLTNDPPRTEGVRGCGKNNTNEFVMPR